ncbi:MauE/DoxX family redox-associated membrane protein [Pedobacter miscanthi]|uniref:MauE/DoxX family redox-associated membrane protein n=1 Tax=Pedobacter miscanthi TaxID=2259170 RepID=UPI00292F69FF|nr:MauE/DoxX family redox-associated membrane protein [Pedobacter miscanthi]
MKNILKVTNSDSQAYSENTDTALSPFRRMTLEVLACILVLLWLYTGLDKLADYNKYWHSMYLQVFPRSVLKIMVPAVPVMELGTAILFFIYRYRTLAYVLSLTLLTGFTTYVALIYLGYFPKRPCACAGLFEHMGWGGHLLVNGALTLVAAVALIIHLKGKGVKGTV